MSYRDSVGNTVDENSG